MLRLLFLIPMFLCLPVAATTVYKSVDAYGRVTFSDQPPTEGSLVDILEYNDPAPVPSAGDAARFAAMREVTDRMAADRRERETARAQARKMQYEAQASQVQIEDYYYDYPYYRGYQRRHRPHHPVLRPPIHRPLPVRGPAITSQYPAKLIRQHYTGAARRIFQPEPFFPVFRHR